VDATNNVYVSDFFNKIVKVFDAEGAFLRTIGTPGQVGPGALDYPTDVAIGENGSVLVADAYNYRIQKFDMQGRPQTSWGWHLFWFIPRPNDAGQGLNVPTAVAFSPEKGHLHIADSANHRVVMLDTKGRYIADWKIEEEPQGYNTPVGVAVSPDGTKVYVTDIDNQRVIILGVKTP